VLAPAIALAITAVLASALPALAAADTVSAFSPACGVVGTEVTITGTGFTAGAPATGVMFPGATQNTVIADSDTQLRANVPVGAAGSGTLTVVDADGNGTSSATFSVATAAAATIGSFLPTSGAVGASVVITGTNFCGTTGVKFNTTAAVAFTVNSATQITATVPTGATTGKITVTNTIGPVVSTLDFTVITGAPTISSFSPISGPEATSVILTGTNFLGATAVKFNGVTATFTVDSNTQITTSVPATAATGLITVTNVLGTGTSTTAFTVTIPAHKRSLSFKFKGSTASGHVNVTDGFTACNSFVPVYIQEQKGGGWKLLDTTATNGGGDFKTWVPNQKGKFRAVVKKLNLLAGNSCGAANSAARSHS